MMKNKLILVVVVLLPLLGFWSCGENPKSNSLVDDTTDDQTIVDESISEALYQMPMPMELFMYMWEDGAPFNIELLNNSKNASSYVETKSKAINLGIYAADIAYCSVYESNKKTVGLFAVSKTMAEDLGLTEGFDPEIIDRIDTNIENADSLFQISKDSYSKTINFLQAEGQINILPYIVYGGWLESVYIVTQSVKEFQPESDIAIRITDQEILLENLIDFFENLPDSDSQAQLVLSDLESLNAIYKGGNKGSVLNAEKYWLLKEKIASLRLQIVE